MDYFDPAHKRAHTIKLYIGYGLMAIVIGFVSLILWFQSYGYDVNRHTGQVIQNGLVYLSAHPVAADIYANGKGEGRTDKKLTIPAGSYSFELRASGYRTWQKTIKLDGGSIEQIVYPFLFPSKLDTFDQQLYATAPQLATQSPDRRWLMVQPTGNLTHFDIFDTGSKDVPQTTADLAADLLTPSNGPQSFSVVEWSTDNRHVLLKHTYANGYEYIMVDRQTPTNSINLNKTLNANPTSISLRDKRFDRLYLYDAPNQTISTADLKTGQVKTLLTKVLYFKAFGPNQVLYVSSDNPNPSEYSVKVWDGSHSYLVHNFPLGGTYLLEMANYSGSDYVVVCSVAKNAVYVFKDPLGQAKSGQTPSAFMLLKINAPQFLSFSDNARFIAIQNGAKFAVYDIDENKRYYFQLSDVLGSDVKATWMDGHRLDLVTAATTEVFDFDGTNLQKLTTNLNGFAPFFDSGYSRLYDIAPSVLVPNRFALTTTDLKI